MDRAFRIAYHGPYLAARRQRRETLSDILLKVADADSDNKFSDLEIRRLFDLIVNMSDQGEESLQPLRAALDKYARRLYRRVGRWQLACYSIS